MQILINTYQHPVSLIISGSGGLVSTEDTTQGDPLAMATYVLLWLFFLLYINYILLTPLAVSQVWYADDATGVGACFFLRK